MSEPSSQGSGGPPNTGGRTVSDDLLDRISLHGIDVCFSNPGTSEMWIVAALTRRSDIRPVLCLHESVAAGAADGFARMTGRPAMTLLHLGAGLSNALTSLHNAKRARQPVLNLVGDMSTWHKKADAPLDSDMEAIAGAVGSCCTVRTVDDLLKSVDAAFEAMKHPTGDSTTASHVHTLIVPHDFTWAPSPPENAARMRQVDAHPAGAQQEESCLPGVGHRALRTQRGDGTGTGDHTLPVTGGQADFIDACARAMQDAPGKLCIMVGGSALEVDGDDAPLILAGKIAAAVNAELFCEPFPARLDRGVGLPRLKRMPYFPEAAREAFSRFEVVVLVDTRRPVAMFGYPGGESMILSCKEENLWEIDAQGADLRSALAALAQKVDAHAIVPGVNCGGLFVTKEKQPPLPEGRLSPPSLCRCLAALQREGDIIVDESLTTGGSYWAAAEAAPRFSQLFLTGGAIGNGPCLSVGAAMGCPDRRVINFQADGSLCYSLPALHSEAREKLNVLTIVCSNRSYHILEVETAQQKIPGAAKSAKPLTELSQPDIAFVSIARGLGVHRGGRASTCDEFVRLWREAEKAMSEEPGPFIIQADL